MTKPRAKTTRWWIESIAALSVMAGFIFWQGKNWEDLSEVKAAVMYAIIEGARSFRRELGSQIAE